MVGYCLMCDRIWKNWEILVGVVFFFGNQLVKVLMLEKLIKDFCFIMLFDVNCYVNSVLEFIKNKMCVCSFGLQYKLMRMKIYSENIQGLWIIGSEGLGEIDQYLFFDVILVDSSEMFFDENCNRIQYKNVN